MGGKSLFGCCVPRKRKKTSSKREPTDAASVPLVSGNKNELANRVSTDEHVTVQAVADNNSSSKPNLSEPSSAQQNVKTSPEALSEHSNAEPATQSRKSSLSSDSAKTPKEEDNKVDEEKHSSSSLSSQSSDKKVEPNLDVHLDQVDAPQSTVEVPSEKNEEHFLKEQSDDSKEIDEPDSFTTQPDVKNDPNETPASAEENVKPVTGQASSSSNSDESFEILDDTILHKKSSINDEGKQENESSQKFSALAEDQVDIKFADEDITTVEEISSETPCSEDLVFTPAKAEIQELASVPAPPEVHEPCSVHTVAKETSPEKNLNDGVKKSSLSSFGSSQTEEYFDASNNSEVYFSTDSTPRREPDNDVHSDARPKEDLALFANIQTSEVDGVSQEQNTFKQEHVIIIGDKEEESQRRSSTSSSESDTLNNIPEIEKQTVSHLDDALQSSNDVSSDKMEESLDEDNSSSDTVKEVSKEITTIQGEGESTEKYDYNADDDAASSSTSLSEPEHSDIAGKEVTSVVNEQSKHEIQNEEVVALPVVDTPESEPSDIASDEVKNADVTTQVVNQILNEEYDNEKNEDDEDKETTETEIIENKDVVETLSTDSFKTASFHQDDTIQLHSGEIPKVHYDSSMAVDTEHKIASDKNKDVEVEADKRRDLVSSSSSNSSDPNSVKEESVKAEIALEESIDADVNIPSESGNVEKPITESVSETPTLDEEKQIEQPQKNRETITFKSGWRRVVQLVDLISARLVSENTAKQLERGTIDEGKIAEELHQYLNGEEPIAGLLIMDTGKKMSLYDASKNRVLLRGTVVSLLEAQAATGSIINPYNGEKMNVEEATKTGLIDKFLASVLVRAERAAFGFKSRLSPTPLSLFEAMKRKLVVESHGIRLLEAQIATGGLIDPRANHRLPVDVAFERGLFDERLNAILEDPSDDTKGFFDPNTNQNLTYLQLMERCVVDEETSLRLLPLYKNKQKKDYWKKTG